jgi:hypothetical protein
MAKRENRINRDKKLVEEFDKMVSKTTPKGKMIHSLDFIYETLADKFYLSERRVRQIICDFKPDEKDNN